MPAFRPTEGEVAGLLNILEPRLPNPALPDSSLSDVDRELIIRWMIGDHRVVFGGSPVGPKMNKPTERLTLTIGFRANSAAQC